MAEESHAGLSEQIKELVTQNEKHMKAIQEQIAHQREAQQKAIGDLIEQQWKAQQKAITDLLERGQERSVKTAEQWEALRKAIADQIEEHWHPCGRPVIEYPRKPLELALEQCPLAL